MDVSNFNMANEPVALFSIHRHSIRSPVCIPPQVKLSFLCEDNFPRGIGYLTDLGIERAVQVGKIWKRWFPQFITGNPREVWARASEVPRCSETCNALLYSMYSSRSNYQPIPIIAPPPNQDKYICSNSLSDEEFFAKIEETPDFEVVDKDGKLMTSQDIFEYLKIQLGFDKDVNKYDIFTCVDGLSLLEYNKLPQPMWYTKNRQIIDAVHNALNDHLTAIMRPYFGYHLLQGVAGRMRQIRDGKAKVGHRLNLFSFHDFSVSAVLAALDSSLSKARAHFLASIFFEIYRRPLDGSLYAVVSWSDGLRPDGTYAARKALPLSWKGGSNKVELDDLLDRFQNNIYAEFMNKQKPLLGYSKGDALV